MPPESSTTAHLPHRIQTGISAHIAGWGMAVPDFVMSNEDLAAIVETSDDWIRERTGIRQRRIATEKDSTATLATDAAKKALEVANILPTELNLIIVATSTPDNVFPSTASIVQDKLGAIYAGAFDLSAACSGFVYALDMASQAIRAGGVRAALVIGAETMSRVLDWQDRGTCILFGDGAGAVVLVAGSGEGGILSSVLRSDGAGSELLCIPTHNAINLHEQKLYKMTMVGSEVFKFATRVVDESIRQAAELAGISVEQLHLIVPHQANQRIIASAAKKLKIDESRFASNIERYGNTSAASIPIALCEAIEQGRVKADDYIAFVGFGGGLAWAAMIVQWGVPRLPSAEQRLMRQRRQLFYVIASVRAWYQRVVRQASLRARRVRNRFARRPSPPK